VRLYKELSDVEHSFANLKDVIDMRPVYHQTAHRVQAHIFVAALANLLHRAIEKKLKAAHIDLSATAALTALKSVRVVDIDLGNGVKKRSVTHGGGLNRASLPSDIIAIRPSSCPAAILGNLTARYQRHEP
jgi:hypothetical protein